MKASIVEDLSSQPLAVTAPGFYSPRVNGKPFLPPPITMTESKYLRRVYPRRTSVPASISCSPCLAR